MTLSDLLQLSLFIYLFTYHDIFFFFPREGPSDGLNIIIWQRSTIADSAAEADRWVGLAIIMTQEDASNSKLT